ncbi:MAG: pyruvate synthase subunit PorB [candidate division WOR-3 bacterium]
MNTTIPVYIPKLINKEENFVYGHRACQGCGLALAVRLILKAAGKNTIIVSPTGCLEIISSPFPQSAWNVPWVHIAFENAAAVASGIESALKILQTKGKIPDKKTNIIAIGGDGGTSDIGLQALSGAFERGHNFLYICVDNEAYMNTGIQRSSSTPFGASTTTSPAGKISIGQITWKKNMPEIAAAHNIPYVATANPSYPLDLIQKVQTALAITGPKYIHCLVQCPTGWGCATDLIIRIGTLAVETGFFPLYEIINGKYRINVDVPKLRPITDYLKYQARFRHLKPADIEIIQKKILQEWQKLKEKAAK